MRNFRVRRELNGCSSEGQWTWKSDFISDIKIVVVTTENNHNKKNDYDHDHGDDNADETREWTKITRLWSFGVPVPFYHFYLRATVRNSIVGAAIKTHKCNNRIGIRTIN